MLGLGTLDLSSDPDAVRVVKDEVVAVSFAAAAGSLMSSVGVNTFECGDALIVGSNGDRWCVSRDRFDVKYRACDDTPAGSPGRYRNVPAPVLAKRMSEPFQIARRAGGDVLTGESGDWVVQYAPGDFGVVDAARFARVYRPLSPR